jgi:nucleoside phosphorylase
MKKTFQRIRFGLMVGVGSGVADALDIRLGDVVVSTPVERNLGVVAYDSGTSGTVISRGPLNKPPDILLIALSTLKAHHVLGSNRMAQYVSDGVLQLPARFAYPGVERDELFEDQYVHVGGYTCDNCDINKLKIRRPRPSLDPAVHYGTIASGIPVIKDVFNRKHLACEEGALCIETEAAGLMNHFPCLVIKGISDYSDSHKNDAWQPYATVVAAAYAKDLLGIISPLEAATASTSFFSMYHLFPWNSVVLGQLVISLDDPGQGFRQAPNELTKEDVGISHQHKLREIVQSTKNSTLYGKLGGILSYPFSTTNENFPEVQEKTYSLLNSGYYFKRLCNNPEARKWFEKTIKYGRNVYIVVEIHTVHESSIGVRNLDTRVAGLNTNLETENREIQWGSPSPGEQVFAVRYRKVHFGWFSSRNMENGFLNTRICWKVFPIRGEQIKVLMKIISLKQLCRILLIRT